MSRVRWSQVGLHLALGTAGLFVLMPFAWMVLTSLTPENRVLAPGLLPGEFTLENFRIVLDTVPIGRYYFNGIVVTGTIFIGQVLVCVPAAYALARLRFRGSDLGLWTVLASLAVPPQVTALPIYFLFSRTGWLDTWLALIVPFVASAFGIFLLRQFFLTIPQSVIDAARIDGATTFTLLWRVLAPMIRPAIVSFGIFSVVFHWNDLFWPLFFLRSNDLATVPYGIADFVAAGSAGGTQYGAQMAASVLAVVPLLAGFLIAQRQIVEGVALSGSQD